jgi:hypothetical protein
MSRKFLQWNRPVIELRVPFIQTLQLRWLALPNGGPWRAFFGNNRSGRGRSRGWQIQTGEMGRYWRFFEFRHCFSCSTLKEGLNSHPAAPLVTTGMEGLIIDQSS